MKKRRTKEGDMVADFFMRKAIAALLDNRQDLLQGLLKTVQIMTGARCPEGHGKDEILLNDDGKAYCAVCDETYCPAGAACDKLQELGY